MFTNLSSTAGEAQRRLQCYCLYLKRCAWWARGPGYLRLGDWYSWLSSAWLVFWLGLLANFTVMGSAAPGGFWQFRPLMASSASTRRSKRMNPTPLDTPEEKNTQLHSHQPWRHAAGDIYKNIYFTLIWSVFPKRSENMWKGCTRRQSLIVSFNSWNTYNDFCCISWLWGIGLLDVVKSHIAVYCLLW